MTLRRELGEPLGLDVEPSPGDAELLVVGFARDPRRPGVPLAAERAEIALLDALVKANEWSLEGLPVDAAIEIVERCGSDVTLTLRRHADNDGDAAGSLAAPPPPPRASELLRRDERGGTASDAAPVRFGRRCDIDLPPPLAAQQSGAGASQLVDV